MEEGEALQSHGSNGACSWKIKGGGEEIPYSSCSLSRIMCQTFSSSESTPLIPVFSVHMGMSTVSIISDCPSQSFLSTQTSSGFPGSLEEVLVLGGKQ